MTLLRSLQQPRKPEDRAKALVKPTDEEEAVTALTLRSLVARNQAAQHDAHEMAINSVLNAVGRSSIPPLSAEQLSVLKPAPSAYGAGVLMEPLKPKKQSRPGPRMAKCCSPSSVRVSYLTREAPEHPRPELQGYFSRSKLALSPSAAAVAAAVELIATHGPDRVGALAFAATAATAAAVAASGAFGGRSPRPSPMCDFRAPPSFSQPPLSLDMPEAGTRLQSSKGDDYLEDGNWGAHHKGGWWGHRPASSRSIGCGQSGLLSSSDTWRLAHSATAPGLTGFTLNGLSPPRERAKQRVIPTSRGVSSSLRTAGKPDADVNSAADSKEDANEGFGSSAWSASEGSERGSSEGGQLGRQEDPTTSDPACMEDAVLAVSRTPVATKPRSTGRNEQVPQRAMPFVRLDAGSLPPRLCSAGSTLPSAAADFEALEGTGGVNDDDSGYACSAWRGARFRSCALASQVHACVPTLLASQAARSSLASSTCLLFVQSCPSL